MTRVNSLGQPIGDLVEGWAGAKWPDRIGLTGRYCTVAPLSAETHADALFDAYADDGSGATWTYMAIGPFDTKEAFRAQIAHLEASRDPHYFAILDSQGQPVGIASFMRIKPNEGSIEVGGIAYAPALLRTAAATEAMSLLMQYAFENPWLPSVRMEMRLPQRPVAQCCSSVGIPIRRPVPAGVSL